jgi:hypothetical protein
MGAQGKKDTMDAAERTFREWIDESASAGAGGGVGSRGACRAEYDGAVAEKKAALAGLEALEPAEPLSAADVLAVVKELGDEGGAGSAGSRHPDLYGG